MLLSFPISCQPRPFGIHQGAGQRTCELQLYIVEKLCVDRDAGIPDQAIQMLLELVKPGNWDVVHNAVCDKRSPSCKGCAFCR